MATTETSLEAGLLAGELFDDMTAGGDFSLPAVDLTGSDFQFPVLDDVEVTSLSEADLTSREVGGSGLFDGLMASVSAHLQEEYRKNRITGAQYAEVYVSMTGAAMQAATQYLLSRDQARWQAALTQRQAQIAEIGVVTARVGLEETKVKLGIARTQNEIVKADYALAKLKLATEDASWSLAKAQLKQTEWQTEFMLPAQLTGITSDNAVKAQQVLESVFRVEEMLPAELTRITAQNALTEAQTTQVTYQTSTMLPAQKLGIDADTGVKQAQADQITYETASLMPAQKKKLDTEDGILTYQLSSFYPAQVAGLTADNAGKTYTNQFILPAQLDSMREQIEGHRAKTLDTRTDGSPVAGQMGAQTELYKEQVTSYKRDAETKAVKMMIDAWTTQKMIQEDLTAPSRLSNADIDTAFNQLRTNLSL